MEPNEVKYVPVSDWTKEVRGAKRVHITGKDDKRQLTATLTVTASGDTETLPAQMIYGGKTPACLPSLDSPWVAYYVLSPNHWANEDTMLSYIHNILYSISQVLVRSLSVTVYLRLCCLITSKHSLPTLFWIL